MALRIICKKIKRVINRKISEKNGVVNVKKEKSRILRSLSNGIEVIKLTPLSKTSQRNL